MSVDDKDRDKKHETFDLLAHEKKISELYHDSKAHQAQEPSAQLDIEIMAMAKKQLSDNSSLVAKDQMIAQQLSSNKNTHNKNQKTWQGPFSLVASVGILGLLFISQRDYFINPSSFVAGDAGVSNGSIIRAPNISEADNFTPETRVVPSFQELKTVVSTHKNEGLLDKPMQLNKKQLLNEEMIAEVSKRMSISQSPKVLTQQMSGKSILEENFVKTAPISLSVMSKMAELLKIEQDIQNISRQEASATSVKMQQTLFENLLQYQKNHAEFEIPEKYLSILTINQIQQLKPVATEAVSEN